MTIWTMRMRKQAATKRRKPRNTKDAYRDARVRLFLLVNFVVDNPVNGRYSMNALRVYAAVAELVDARDSKSLGCNGHEGSIPSRGIKRALIFGEGFFK